MNELLKAPSAPDAIKLVNAIDFTKGLAKYQHMVPKYMQAMPDKVVEIKADSAFVAHWMYTKVALLYFASPDLQVETSCGMKFCTTWVWMLRASHGRLQPTVGGHGT